MLPWRPLGMLIFGLSAIFVFIRLHGDGYDFPEELFLSQDELHLQPPPTRSFMEVSRVVLDDYQDYYGDESDDGSFKTEESDYRHRHGHGQDQGHKVVVRSNTQWHLGKDRAKVVATDQAATDAQDDRGKSGHDLLKEYQDGKQWIWLTNVWHEDGACGPGLLRQYRRRLDHVLANNNENQWELMYTHRFPGPITHTSLSKRVLPRRARGRHPTETAESAEPRISTRLAVVYKVVQDEHIAYRSRIYHFGVFHSHQDLEGETVECRSTSKDTCHVKNAFVSFDYVLPGSTPIKDFSLDHDTILYSRLSDEYYFRSLKLPRLKVGSTSFERPFALSYGVPGLSMGSTGCDEKRNIPYRMSFLTNVRSGSDSNLQVMMGQVLEARNIWFYRLAVAYETTDVTGSKRWHMRGGGGGWLEKPFPSLTQETNMIDNELQQSGVPLQKPFFVKSADGSSISIPVKNVIHSYEAIRVSRPVAIVNGEGDADDDYGQEGRRFHESPPESGDHLLVQDNSRASETLPVSSWEHEWSESTIMPGPAESVDTDFGVINDATDIMVLRTTRNEILIMKRAVQTTEDGQRSVSAWELSMAMETAGIITGVLAMKIINVPALPSKSSVGDAATPVAKEAHPLGYTDPEDDPQASPTAPSAPLSPTTRNILLIVYGSGKLRGFDMDHPQVSSSFEEFLKDKFAVVIGMLAVVVAFVINEAR